MAKQPDLNDIRSTKFVAAYQRQLPQLQENQNTFQNTNDQTTHITQPNPSLQQQNVIPAIQNYSQCLPQRKLMESSPRNIKRMSFINKNTGKTISSITIPDPAKDLNISQKQDFITLQQQQQQKQLNIQPKFNNTTSSILNLNQNQFQYQQQQNNPLKNNTTLNNEINFRTIIEQSEKVEQLNDLESECSPVQNQKVEIQNQYQQEINKQEDFSFNKFSVNNVQNFIANENQENFNLYQQVKPPEFLQQYQDDNYSQYSVISKVDPFEYDCDQYQSFQQQLGGQVNLKQKLNQIQNKLNIEDIINPQNQGTNQQITEFIQFQGVQQHTINDLKEKIQMLKDRVKAQDSQIAELDVQLGPWDQQQIDKQAQNLTLIDLFKNLRGIQVIKSCEQDLTPESSFEQKVWAKDRFYIKMGNENKSVEYYLQKINSNYILYEFIRKSEGLQIQESLCQDFEFCVSELILLGDELLKPFNKE